MVVLVKIAPTVFMALFKRLGVSYLQAHYLLLDKRIVKAANKKEIRLYVWTVNREKSMHRMIKIGVGGIMSDRVELLKKVFNLPKD